MVYLVRAIHIDGVTGTVTAKKNTRPEAFELAKNLRAAGLWVIVTGPESMSNRALPAHSRCHVGRTCSRRARRLGCPVAVARLI
jgi:hypothetical protein